MTAPSDPPLSTPSPDEALKVTLPSEATPSERWLWRGLLFVICLLAYASSMTSDKFIWDDERHAGAYAQLRSPDALSDIWTKLGRETGGTPQYYPLTHTTYWLEYQIFGEHPAGFRVVNVLVHAGCAVLLWELLRKLRVPGAYLAAVIFAAHPLMAESVAWVSERKNTLSLLLSLASLMAYARFAGVGEYEEEAAALREKKQFPDWNMYALASLAFVGAMLSKTTAGYVPILLLLGLWWKRRLTARDMGLILPWMVVAVGLGLLTAFIEYKHVIRPGVNMADENFGGWLSAKFSGTLRTPSEFRTPWDQRVLMSGMVPVFYLYKFFVPAMLTFWYPRWHLDSAPAWEWGGVALVLLSLAWAGWAASRGKRWPMVLVVGYLVALFPAMGFFDVYPFRYSYVADHFAYPAIWMVVVAVSSGIAVYAGRAGVARRPGVVLGGGAAIVLLLMARTYVHALNFRDNSALFDQVLAHNRDSWAAMDNLATEELNFGNKALATAKMFAAEHNVEDQQKALELSVGDFARAENLLDRALILKPDNDRAMLLLARVYAFQGRRDDALAQYRRAAATAEGNPDTRDGANPDAYTQIGIILRTKGDLAGAKENLRKAISLERPPIFPKSGTPRLELLKILSAELPARFAAATRETIPSPATTRASSRPLLFQRLSNEEIAEITNLAADVTELLPKSFEGWMLAGDLMRDAGRTELAVKAYSKALGLAPNSPDALVALGSAMGDQGDYLGAQVAFTGALKIDPKRGDARRMLEITERLMEQRRAATRAATGPSSRPTP